MSIIKLDKENCIRWLCLLVYVTVVFLFLNGVVLYSTSAGEECEYSTSQPVVS